MSEDSDLRPNLQLLLVKLQMLIATLDPMHVEGEKKVRQAIAMIDRIFASFALRDSKLDYSSDLRFVPWTASLYDGWLQMCGMSSGGFGIVIPRIGARGWRVDEDICVKCAEYFDTEVRGHASWHCPVDRGVTFFIGSDSKDYSVFIDPDDLDLGEQDPRLEIHVASSQVKNDLRDMLGIEWS